MRNGEPGWFASLLGAAVLIAGGFALGLVAGVVSEEPELVVGHLAGRSDDVAWLPEAEAEFTPAAEEIVRLDSVAPLGQVLAQEERAREVRGEGEAEVQGEVLEEPRYALAADEDPAWLDEAPLDDVQLPSVAAAPPRREPSPFRDISSLPATGESVAPPAAPAARAPSSNAAERRASRSGFSVQVGAFSDSAAADEVREKLLARGFESYVIPASRGGDGKWRVRVGPEPSREAAESLAGRLKSEERLPTWVLSEGGG